MDRTSKFLTILVISGTITACTGSIFIPQTGGTIPPGQNLEDYTKQQEMAMYNSTAFKVTMVATGITVIGLIIIIIRSCRDDYDPQQFLSEQIPKSILKVKRSTIIPVEDVRPQVKTTPNFGALPEPVAAISSSPPIQLVPNMYDIHNFKPNPVIQKIKFQEKFKYPIPYDVLNRKN
jgi:hypothetical protein